MDREKKSEYNRLYRLKRLDELRQMSHDYYWNHRLEQIQKARDYRKANVTKSRNDAKRYYDSHREGINLKRRKRSPEEKAIHNAKQKEYIAKMKREHPELWQERQTRRSHEAYWQHRAEHLERTKKDKKELRRVAIEAYGGFLCKCCSETTPEFLGIDHINGGGYKHRQEIKASGASFYGWLKKHNYPSGYQILCHNCNQAKGFYGSCPHQR